jgi:signal transduction histidine kinase
MSSALGNATVVRLVPRTERAGEDEARRRLEVERLRIARELHDVVAHGFATIALQAGVAAHVVDDHPEQAAEALRAIRAASKDVMGEMRTILGMLRADGDAEEGPGLHRIDALARTASSAGVQTSVHVSGRWRTLPPAVDLAAYRIVQEALTNVLRHAGRASARVSISYEPRRLVVTVEDDGAGHVADQASDGSGYGILGMRERVLAVGGELEAGPRAEGGYRVSASVPVFGRS